MRRAASAVVVVLVVLLACAPGAVAAPALSGSFAVSDMPGKIAAGARREHVGRHRRIEARPRQAGRDGRRVRPHPGDECQGHHQWARWQPLGDGDGERPQGPPAAPLTFTTTPLADITTAQAITTGPDGNLWTASAAKVLKIPPAAPATATTFPVAGLDARGIASSGGLLWVADFSGRIVSLTTAGTATPYVVGGGPQGIGAGRGGQILYSNAINIDPYNVGRLVAAARRC